MPSDDVSQPVSNRIPWNKGKLTGPKPPLRPKNVWSIRTRLQVEGRIRDLAMFNFAIDSKLRACDVVRIKMDDVAPHGRALSRVTIRQKKTGQPVTFEMTDQTRQSIDEYVRVVCKKPGDFLFASRRQGYRAMSTRQYARIVSTWIASIRAYSGRIHFAAPRQPSSIVAQAIYAPCSSYSGTRGSKAPYAISGLR